MNENGKGMSIAAMIFGIAGFILSCIILGVVPSIISLILSVVGLVKGSGKRGFNIAGLILSIIGIIIAVYILIVSFDVIVQSFSQKLAIVDTVTMFLS